MKRPPEEQLKHLNDSPSSEPDFRWVASLRAKFEWTMARGEALSPATQLPPRRFAWTARPFAAAALALAVLLLIGGGVTYAAQGAVPGNPLYPVKLVSEEVRLKLAASDTARTELELTLASRRVEEFRVLSAQDKVTPEQAADLTARYEAHVSAALITLPTLPDEVVAGMTESISQTIDAHLDISAAWEGDREEEDSRDDEETRSHNAARAPLQQRREEVKKQIDRMREFARETRHAAKLLKESARDELKLDIKVETGDDGRAHVKIEAEQKNKGKERKEKIEFTVPRGTSTSTLDMLKSFNDENGNNSGDDTHATTTIFYNSRDAQPFSPTSTLRFSNPGTSINIKMESSGEGSVSQEIKSEITSESKIEFKSNSNLYDIDEDDN